MKSLSNCENPSNNPFFMKLVPTFCQPPVTPKVISKAACDPENCSKIYQWEGMPEQKLYAPTEQTSELVSVIKEASMDFITISL
jgi:hypothetical protein